MNNEQFHISHNNREDLSSGCKASRVQCLYYGSLQWSNHHNTLKASKYEQCHIKINENRVDIHIVPSPEANRGLSNLMNDDEKTKHCSKLSPAVNRHSPIDNWICSCPKPYLGWKVSIPTVHSLHLPHTKAAPLLSLNGACHFLK